MTLKMCHWGTGGRDDLDFCCGCLHGAEGPRILEVVKRDTYGYEI